RRVLFRSPLTSLLGSDELRVEQARVEEAHDTLLDPLRRKAYDASMFPDEQTHKPPLRAVPDAAAEAERMVLRQELAREITQETEFTGRLLRKVREAQGIELEDITKQTKISVAHLRAIEAEAYAELPPLVYTRGFVRELAKYLKLDPTQVTRTYLSRMRAALAPEEAAGSGARPGGRPPTAAIGRSCSRSCSSPCCLACTWRSPGRASRSGTDTTTTAARSASPPGSAIRKTCG